VTAVLRPTRRVALGLLMTGLSWVVPGVSEAAPPEPTSAPVSTNATLRGRVRERGPERSPVSGAVVMLVAAPDDVRPGTPAEQPLDPDAVTWMLRAETDGEGRFELADVPIGKLRVIVVAGGYVRHELWAALERDGGELELWLEPERGGSYRTEVVVERLGAAFEQPPQRTLSGAAARGYPGSGDDPMLGALNLPGVMRSPGGLGMLSFRGGDPNEVGVYVDGHPVPRAFHVLPIASVVSPPLVDQISIDPGNYATAYGGFGGGLVRIDSRQGGREGIHGRAHVDLFDAGATLDGPVGKGSVAVGIRRSHVGDLLRLIDVLPFAAPNFWDYLARFDHPVGRGHALGLRSLGAGDRLTLSEFFDLRTSFHRFDFDYRFTNDRWQILISPSVRLDRISLDGYGNARRLARVYSGRASARWQPAKGFALELGFDAVVERWSRRQQYGTQQDSGEIILDPDIQQSSGDNLRFGAWLGMPLRLRDYSLIPSLRLNVFDYGADPLVRADPRIHFRGPLAGPVQMLAAVGLYGVPVIGGRDPPSEGYLTQGGDLLGGFAELPESLLTYFDPNVAGEAVGSLVRTTHVVQASMGFEATLPWALELHALGFYRGSGAVAFGLIESDPDDEPDDEPDDGYVGRRRAAGLELMLRRPPTQGGVVDGWIGYTLLMARVEEEPDVWQAALFDQRHNLVTLLGFSLPRNFRLGLRFRLGSGNPERPITGRETIQDSSGVFVYRPIRGPRGASYQPLFHQLDIRLDKRWMLRRTSVAVYLDVQNVYNHVYSEIFIYSSNWSHRQAGLGLPIYPSIGVEVTY
jgi:hypothetical protein